MSAAVQGVAVGRAEDDRTRLSRAILLLLEGLSVRQGRYLRALKEYQGELGDGEALDQVMTRLKGNSPAVLVAIGGDSYSSKSTTRRKYMVRYQVELAVISGHLTSLTARGSGGSDRYVDQADPGIYQMLHDVRSKLAGRSPNIAGGHTIVPVGTNIILQTNDLVIYSASYTVDVHFHQPSHSDNAPHAAESSDVTATLSVEAPQ